MTARAGCSYFGVRILRHVRRDLEDIAARGYTDVLHTFSENDLAYYRGTMAEIVAASHAVGLGVQMAPWGLGRTFGGEAESRFVTMRPEACQVLDDGRRVATGCLNNEVYRAYCRDWADAAIEAGADRVFWDEPHWTVPEHVGVDDEDRWACCCDLCRRLYEERYGEPMPAALTPEVMAFREASTVDFLRDMLEHVSARGGRSTICLLPLVEGPHGVSDWDAVAALPGLDTLATDPYWKNFDESAGSFVGRFARLVAETASRHGVGAQLWVPSFGLTHEDVPDLEAAIASSRAAGIDDLWTWGYEACGHMTHLATADAPLVWEAVTRALTQRGPITEAARVDLRDLDLRPTPELVRVINTEDRTVAEAIAAAAPELAAAIDAIVERLRAGGRLIYVGAGSSGRLAAVDAAECGPTFSVAPGQVIAVLAGGMGAAAVAQEAAEDDAEAGAADLAAVRVAAADAVVALSASGRTPYTLGALARAAEAGALTVAVACARDSQLGRAAEHEVVAEVGPEVISGSTRMKAGTAQKLVLNTISTIAMVRLGKTFGNLMVDVQASNEKLRARARRAVALATGSSEEEVDAALAAADGEVKVAIVSLAAGVDPQTARSRLAEAGGAVRQALGEPADVVG
jgi:N-acetylmuramic acid 6-phosphate etherase